MGIISTACHRQCFQNDLGTHHLVLLWTPLKISVLEYLASKILNFCIKKKKKWNLTSKFKTRFAYRLINEEVNQTIIQGNVMKYSGKELHVACSKTQSTFRSGLANICGILGFVLHTLGSCIFFN